MTVVKRGARAGAAAVALGVSLIGPQAAGTAAADSPENDSPSASASQPSQHHEGERRGRSAPSAQAADSNADLPRQGRISPQPAAAISAGDVPVATAGEPQPSRPLAGRGRSAQPLRDSALPVAQPTAGSSPVSATVATINSNVAAGYAAGTGAKPAQSAVPVLAAPAASPVPLPAAAIANPVTASASARVQAPVVAALGAAVTGFFDSTANWLSTLPASPLTEFFEGALLLVRRSLLQHLPGTERRADHRADQHRPGVLHQGPVAGLPADNGQAAVRRPVRPDRPGVRLRALPSSTSRPTPRHCRHRAPTPRSTVSTRPTTSRTTASTSTSHTTASLTIVRAGDTSVASQSALSGDVLGEYLSGDRLTVITQSGSGWYGPQVKMAYGPW